jgi:hypothetical protein
MLNDGWQRYDGRIIQHDLKKTWNSHWLMNKLREQVRPLVEQLLSAAPLPFDPQDLEHQVLFLLTTYSPSEITDDIISAAVQDQANLVEDRLRSLADQVDLRHLFRGLGCEADDLNVQRRLKLTNRCGQLRAVADDGRSFNVVFKIVDDPAVVSLFTGDLHYIHQERSEGDAFGLFFEGDRYPWAIETAEPALKARGYKKAALKAQGISVEKAVELTRLYTLPGSPINAVSVLDGLVSRHYRQQGMEAIFTRTMPSYSKSKSTTVAGGMDRVLCLKELKHFFVRDRASGSWRPVSRRYLEQHPNEEARMTDLAFQLLPAVDVYMALRSLKGVPDEALEPGLSLFFPETYAPHHHRHDEPAQVYEAFGARLGAVLAGVGRRLARA